MIYLNEKEIINKYLDILKQTAQKNLNITLNIKKLKVDNPEESEEYKNYKNGDNSSLVKVDFEMQGWKTYSDEGFENFCHSILELDEQFFPIINLDVYEIAGKGRVSVNMDFTFVFIRTDVQDDKFWEYGENKDSLVKEEVIRDIEIRLSEIYSLLTKLKKM